MTSVLIDCCLSDVVDVVAGFVDVDIVVDYLKHHSPLDTVVEGRTTFLPERPTNCSQQLSDAAVTSSAPQISYSVTEALSAPSDAVTSSAQQISYDAVFALVLYLSRQLFVAGSIK